MIFRIDGFHLSIGPAHHLNWFDIFANVTSCDLYTMAAQVKDATTTCLFFIPKPFTMGARVGFSRFGPKDSTKRTFPYTFISLQELGRIYKIFQVTVKNACLLNGL